MTLLWEDTTITSLSSGNLTLSDSALNYTILIISHCPSNSYRSLEQVTLWPHPQLDQLIEIIDLGNITSGSNTTFVCGRPLTLTGTNTISYGTSFYKYTNGNQDPK